MANKSYCVNILHKFPITNFTPSLTNYIKALYHGYNNAINFGDIRYTLLDINKCYKLSDKIHSIVWTEFKGDNTFDLPEFKDQILFKTDTELKLYDKIRSGYTISVPIVDKNLKYTILNNKLYIMQNNNHIMTLDKKIDAKFDDIQICFMEVIGNHIIVSCKGPIRQYLYIGHQYPISQPITYILSASNFSVIDKLDDYTLYDLTHNDIMVLVGFQNNKYKCYYYHIKQKRFLDNGNFIKWLNNDEILEFTPTNEADISNAAQSGDIIIKSFSFDGKKDVNECCICMEKIKKKIALIPCGHTQICDKCIKSITKCAICNQQYTNTLNIY